jgi:molybdate transport system substrate-binding protein
MSAAVSAHAAELTLIAPGGIRAPFAELIPAFERKSGHKVTVTFGSGNGTKERVVHGDAFDVPVVQPPYESVIASGHVVAASATPLATVALGIAIRTGAPKPDIATSEAVKRLLLAARAVSYPDPSGGAAAGVSFEAVLQKLGIAEAMKGKLKTARAGSGAMVLLAQGDVDLGVTFISEIISEPGVAVVGPFPRDLSTPTALVAFVSAQSKEPEAAKALIAFLSSPEASPVYKARGMEPNR